MALTTNNADIRRRMIRELSIDQIVVASRQAAPALTSILSDMRKVLRSGVSTRDVNAAVEQALTSADLLPAMKDYNGYPFSTDISINEEVVHGFPSHRILAEGDIVSLGVGGISHAAYVHQCWTYAVGHYADRELLAAPMRALARIEAEVAAGDRLGHIGAIIEETADERGLTVVEDYVGYGMGRERIQKPQIKGTGRRDRGLRLSKCSKILNVHVIYKRGEPGIDILENGWTAVAHDRQHSAVATCMYEITDAGLSRLTGRP